MKNLTPEYPYLVVETSDLKLSTFALLSCAKTVIHMRDLTALRIRIAPDVPPRIMGLPPKEVFEWTMATTGDSIIVQSYLLATGEYSTTYFFAYRNEALIFWGYPQEFAKSSDPLLREIGKEAIRRHVKRVYYRELQALSILRLPQNVP